MHCSSLYQYARAGGAQSSAEMLLSSQACDYIAFARSRGYVVQFGSAASVQARASARQGLLHRAPAVLFAAQAVRGDGGGTAFPNKWKVSHGRCDSVPACTDALHSCTGQ